MSNVPRFWTHPAKHWALKELARRAGAGSAEFARWKIEFSSESSILHLPEGSCIRFPSWEHETLQTTLGELITNNAAWLENTPPPGLIIPNFIVPFCARRLSDLPLFVHVAPSVVDCNFDLITATLLTLLRAEEMQNSTRDEHQRFPGPASVAFRDRFLDRPIVDEYGMALAQVMGVLRPKWKPQLRSMSVKLSHDIDDLDVLFSGMPQRFRLKGNDLIRGSWMVLPASVRTAIQTATQDRKPVLAAKAIFQSVTGARPNLLKLAQELCALSLEYDLDSAFYWKGSNLTPFDSGYDPCSKKIKSLIREVADKGFENGVHPGYFTYQNPEELQREVSRLTEAIGRSQLGGRQHYLRWSPETWRDWERAGLAYDSSVGFADLSGFRAGTCIPYKPWLLEEDRESRLLEIPLILMESTMRDYMGETRHEVLMETVNYYFRKCSEVGGVFTFLFHNKSLQYLGMRSFYVSVLKQLAGSPRFDWSAAISEKWPADNWGVCDSA